MTEEEISYRYSVLIREAGPIANILNVIVIGVGYYFLIRLYREWIRQNREERVAGGRPMVVVATDYSHLPRVNIVVRNFTKAPAKEIYFDFSAPVVSSNGLVLSDLPLFKEGLPFIEPEGRISCFWGFLPSLSPMLREKGLEEGIKVTTRYKDLAEESYETEWNLNPLLFESAPIEDFKGMNDLVTAVEKVSKDDGREGHQRAASSEEGQGWPD